MAQSYTPRLGLPEMASGEQSGYVTFNELGQMLDGILNVAVESATTTTPPVSPLDGQLWYVPQGATGAWAGNEEKIAQWYNGQWWYYDTEGMVIYVKDAGEFLIPARPDSGAYMALGGAAATGVSITTTPTGLDIADTQVLPLQAPNPTTIDYANSRFTVNDHDQPVLALMSGQASIDGPQAAEVYLMGIYKNDVLEAHARSAFSTTNQFGSGMAVIVEAPVEIQTGDVIELRFWTTNDARTVTFQSFSFILYDPR